MRSTGTDRPRRIEDEKILKLTNYLVRNIDLIRRVLLYFPSVLVIESGGYTNVIIIKK